MDILFLLQEATDSLATQIGSDVGAQVSVLVASILALANKYVTDAGKWILGKFGTLPSWSKAALALVFAEGVVFLNASFGLELSTDVSALVTSLSGLLVWVASMGWHSFLKLFRKETPTT